MILLSSAIPKKMDEFVKKYLIDPVIISEDYTAIPQFNVIQEVLYIKPEEKNSAILEAIQKTAPQVVIFCENKRDVEEVHDFLIIKGIKSTAAHGNMGKVFLIIIFGKMSTKKQKL
jgi:ATP-dependent RNA helicase DDX41